MKKTDVQPRARLKKWLNDAIVIAHELQGKLPRCCGCEVHIPEDVVKHLHELRVIQRENNQYTFIVEFNKIWVTAFIIPIEAIRSLNPIRTAIEVKIRF